MIISAPQNAVVHDDNEPGVNVDWSTFSTQSPYAKFGAPNFAYGLCVEKVDQSTLTPGSLSSWTTAFCGAEIIMPSTIRRFADVFQPAGFSESSFQCCYGMAEATLLVSAGKHNVKPSIKSFTEERLSVVTGDRVPSSRTVSFVGCGTPVNTDVIIIDDNNQEVKPGLPGDICIHGPGV